MVSGVECGAEERLLSRLHGWTWHATYEVSGLHSPPTKANTPPPKKPTTQMVSHDSHFLFSPAFKGCAQCQE